MINNNNFNIPEPSLDPPEPHIPVCPICGEETDTFYTDYKGDVIGCDCCIQEVNAWDWRDSHSD